MTDDERNANDLAARGCNSVGRVSASQAAHVPEKAHKGPRILEDARTAEAGAVPPCTTGSRPETAHTPWGPRWIIAGLKADRRRLARQRLRLATSRGVPDDVVTAGIEAYDAIVAEIDTQIRGLDVVAAEAEEVAG